MSGDPVVRVRAVVVVMTRRALLGLLAGAVLDPERALYVPKRYVNGWTPGDVGAGFSYRFVLLDCWRRLPDHRWENYVVDPRGRVLSRYTWPFANPPCSFVTVNGPVPPPSHFAVVHEKG